MTCKGKIGYLSCALLALSTLAGPANAELMTFKVVPAFAPNGMNSPSWANYGFRAIAHIPDANYSEDRTADPTAYERVSGPISPHEMIYTPMFPSWRGTADPNPAFVAPFLGEHGNRIHFGLHVVGSADWDFALDDLTWELSSDDADGYFNQSGNFTGANYSATRVGIHYGPDGIKGGGDDVTINAGSGLQRVHELIYVGVGDGFLSDNPEALTGQADIDQTLSDLMVGCGDLEGCIVNLTATYTLPDHTGQRVAASGNVEILLVPEPATSLLGGLGLLVSCALWRRRGGMVPIV